jgi:hypothetical protein
MAGQVIAQLDRTARGTIMREPVWTGAMMTQPDQPSPNASCLDWTTNSASEFGGHGGSEFSTSGFFASGLSMCDATNHHLYCVQQ